MALMAGEPGVILQTMLGPYGGWFRVVDDGPATIGRAVECEVCLLHEQVGRKHATLMKHGPAWFVVDLGTPGGTFVNGVRLEPDAPTPITASDLLRVGPWTFRVAPGAPGAGAGASAESADDGPATGAVTPAATFRLRLLSDCLSKLGASLGEEAMARIALEAAIEGSGYRAGAMLKPIDVPGQEERDISVVSAVRMGPLSDRERRFGRTILRAAWKSATTGRAEPVAAESASAAGPVGGVAEASSAGPVHSILCVPVLLGQTLVSFLYLDAQGHKAQIRPDAAEFVEAVAAAYGLALANMRRIELDRRQQTLAAELHAAREAQQFILPPARGEFGFVRYAMQMTPGLFVAGDLFDAVPLEDGRVAVLLGDVSGHGVGSAMLMAATQSHLHAELKDGQGPAAAVTAVNEYLAARTLGGRFVSLWVGLFARDGTVEYVDAGHGYWMHLPSGAGPGSDETGIPVGIDAGRRYESRLMTLRPGERILAFSDGMIEQRKPGGLELGIAGLRGAVAMCRSADEDVRSAMNTLRTHMASGKLADDATVASIEFLG